MNDDFPRLHIDSGQSLKAMDLRCEHAIDPTAIDTDNPRFSWVVEGAGRGAFQAAYHIVVGLSAEEVRAGLGGTWDSGEIRSSRASSVLMGTRCSSRTRYAWAVRLRDEAGRWGEFSDAAWFETPLAPDEWNASWIGNADAHPHVVSPMLRTEFRLFKPIVNARAYVTGLGYFELRLNGRKVGSSVLDPGWTDTDERVLFVTHDVTEMLREGVNAVGAQLGVGRFRNPPGAHLEAQTQFLLQIHVAHCDGSETVITTDNESGWLATGDTPITHNDLFEGETYDARNEMPGWDEPGFPVDPLRWHPAVVVEPPHGRLVPQVLEPIEVVEDLVPATRTEPAPGVVVYDIGQNIAGWVRLRLQGDVGTRVVLRFAEMLHADGTVNQTNLRAATATDTYVLSGKGLEEWEPRFTYHGFRYVQVEGLTGAQATDDLLMGRVVRSAVRSIGTFSSSNPFINQLHQAIVRTEAGNLHSLPTDCPQRDQRIGWLNDMTVRAEEAVFNFELARLYGKWVGDIVDAQGPVTGAIADTAPYRIAGDRPADPIAASFLLVPWLTYLHYGDDRTLRENYRHFVAWFRYLQSIEQDGLLEFSRYGDWAPPMTESVGDESIGAGALAANTPGGLISSGFYYYHALLLARFATVLGIEDDRSEFDSLAQRTNAAINAHYFDIGTHQYGSGNQACNAFALYLGIVPENEQQAVLTNLVRDIEDHDFHLTTGNLTTKYLIDVLTEHGNGEIAWKLVTQRSYPSWGFMLDNGATTIWERWEHVTGGRQAHMASYNHPMYGAVGAWFYRYLAGIDPSPTGPGFARFRIKPHLLGDLTEVDCTLETVSGRIAVNWKRSGEEIAMDVSVPGNSRAEIFVPTGSAETPIHENGTSVWEANKPTEAGAGIEAADYHAGWVRFTLGSGFYQFRSSVKTTP